jgi:hypothetical protein
MGKDMPNRKKKTAAVVASATTDESFTSAMNDLTSVVSKIIMLCADRGIVLPDDIGELMTTDLVAAVGRVRNAHVLDTPARAGLADRINKTTDDLCTRLRETEYVRANLKGHLDSLLGLAELAASDADSNNAATRGLWHLAEQALDYCADWDMQTTEAHDRAKRLLKLIQGAGTDDLDATVEANRQIAHGQQRIWTAAYSIANELR